MRERRQRALARGAALKAREVDPFSADGLEARLAELGLPSFGGCVSDPEALGAAGVLVPWRLLRPTDYQGPAPATSPAAGSSSGGRRAAILPVVYIGCTLRVSAHPVATGGFVAEAREVRLLALFDREASWWNPAAAGDSAVGHHGQLHFDLAHVLAREARRAHREPLRARGPTAQAARDALALRWSETLGTLQRELRRLQRALDAESSFGWSPEADTRWEPRIRRGAAAVRALAPSDR